MQKKLKPTRVFSGEIFRELRKEAGLTGTQIAHLMGITQSCVSQWTIGYAQPSVEKVVILSDILGCRIDDLFAKNEEVSNGDLA